MTFEDAIKWLDNLKNDLGNPHYERLWPYAQAIDEICELLEEQEPRVMTLEEATNAECVFYEWRTRGVRPAKVIRVPYKTGTYRVQRFGDIDEWVHADEYGEYWRCWTALPTEEQRRAIDAQREAVKWK